MAKRVKKQKAEQQANIWSNADFKSHIEMLITGGILKESGNAGLLVALNQWLAKKKLPSVTDKSLSAHLDKLVWNANRLTLLRNFVRLGLGLDEVYRTLGYLPQSLIDQKSKKLRGHSAKKTDLKISSQAGIGRLIVDSEVAKTKIIILPLTNPQSPFVIPVADANKFKLAIINGPHIGLEFNPVFSENVIHNAFLRAEQQRADAILLTSGLMWLDVRKSTGELTTHRALLSGINFEPSVMDPDYVEEAKRIREKLPPDEVGFINLRERFHNLLSGWRKNVTDQDGNPVFSGKVYIFFSREEELLIEAAAHNHVLYITTVSRNRVMMERKGLEAQLRYLIKEDGDLKEIAELQLCINVLLAREKRMVQTNVDHEDRRRFVDILRSYVINSFKKVIPNCEVVAQGTCFTKIGDKIMEIHQWREDRPNDDFLDKFLKENAGQRGLEGTLADVVLLAGAYSKNLRFGVTERMKEGQRLSSYIWQLPVALDKDLLKRRLNPMVRKGSPIERLLRDDQFEPGVFFLGFNNGVWLPEFCNVGMLVEFQNKTKNRRKVSDGYIYLFADSDNHFGHQWKEYFWDAENDRWLGLESAVIEILRRCYLKKRKQVPLHGYVGLGDRTQGHHFPSESQPHTRTDLYYDLEQRFACLYKEATSESCDKNQALEKMRELRRQALEQIRFRGEHWPQRQILDVFGSFLEPNVDFFLSVLKRSEQAGVRWRGVGEILFGRPDTRDLGTINDVTGNHYSKTVENELTEFFYADKLIDLLYAGQRKKIFSRNRLRQLIKAPVFGNLGIGYGTVAVGGGYEWGIALRHDPSKKSGQNGDPLRQAPKNVLERGDFSRFFSGRRTIHLSGDVHRFGLVQAPKVTVVSCAAGTDTDPFGEHGFSPNNIGNLVVGLPVGGPNQGPIRLIVFNHDLVRKYLLSPWEIDFDSVFVDAV